MRDDSVGRREPDDDGKDTYGDDGGCDAEYEREPGRSRANGHRRPRLHRAHAGHRLDEPGLRAIAVISVLLYHLGVPPFSGGFVGVDIFFVISGYLITGIILSEARSSRFSFADFYARRGRRLLPALVATIAVTFLGGIEVLLRADEADGA
jgi:hypothetical protein